MKMLPLMLWKYLRSNWLYSLVIGYMLIAVLVQFLFQWDIGIPCLITAITGHHCPGCGLTRATMHLMQFNIHEAWHMNPLVFIVLPALAFFITKDFLQFRKESRT